MGCSFSCRSSSDHQFTSIKVVHLSGYVEEFQEPIFVSEVTGNPSKHLVFTPSELLQSVTKPLKLDAQLQLGSIYFMLPNSLFHQSCVSSVELAQIARKLSSVAKTDTLSEAKQKSGKRSITSLSSGGCRRPRPSSGGTSPDRFSGRSIRVEPEPKLEAEEPRKSRSWKPILSTIKERSFNRRSESDVCEN